MPLIKESPSTKAARLQRKAVQLKNKASMEKVKALLQNRPELVQATLTHLENPMDETSQGMAKTPVKAGPSPQGSPSQGSLGGHEEGSSPLSEDVPVRYTSIEELSVKHLKQILFKCEPIAIGPFAIRALAKRGAREVAKQNPTQLIEYVTGVEPSVTINGGERKFTNLIQRLVDPSSERGNLGRPLQLPPDWARQGFYEITDVNPLTVKNKAGLEVQVADEFLPDDIEKKALYVSTNWSEKRAKAPRPLTRILPGSTDIAFDEVRSFLPGVKGCTFHKDVKRHFRWKIPYPTASPPHSKSCSWGGHTSEANALRSVLAWAWEQHAAATREASDFDLVLL